MSNKENKRASLQNKLKNLFLSDPKVSVNMNIDQGLFRLAMSENEVIGYLNNKPVKTFKIAELDADVRNALKENPEEAGKMILDELIASTGDKMEKESKYKGDSINHDKQMTSITETTLGEGDVLHKRQDDDRTDITQKQLDSGSANYDHTKRLDDDNSSITESQLEAKKNPNADTSPREDKERDSITNKQLEDPTEYPAGGNRNEEADGTTQKQLEKDFHKEQGEGIGTTEKQLAGKEQPHDATLVRRLASKEEALGFAKAMAHATARTIVANKLDKDETIGALKKSVRNFASQMRLLKKLKQAQLEDLEPTIIDRENVDPESVAESTFGDSEIADKYDPELSLEVSPTLFDKEKFNSLVDEFVATVELEFGAEGEGDDLDSGDLLDEALDDELGDDLGHQDEMDAMDRDLQQVDQDLGMAAGSDGNVKTAKKPVPEAFLENIEKMKNKSKDKKSDDDDDSDTEASDEDEDDEKDGETDKEASTSCSTCNCKEGECPGCSTCDDCKCVDKKEASADDGLICIEGEISELGLEDDSDTEKMVSAGYQLGYKIAKKDSPDEELAKFRFDVNKEKGLFRAIFAKTASLNVKSANVKEEIDKRASAREDKLNKVAQMDSGGGMAPEMGGEQGGSGTTMPSGPGDGAAEMGIPPIESFEEGGEEGELGDEQNGGGEPTPPGTRCPVCGDDDVDVENGHFECNSCGGEGDIFVDMEVTRWPGTIEDTAKNADGEEMDMEEDLGMEEDMGMGDDMGMGGDMGMEMPLAASVTTLSKKFLKASSVKNLKNSYRVGGHCPSCGSDNTEVSHKGLGQCLGCSQLYLAKLASSNKGLKQITVWKPILEKGTCEECTEKTASATSNVKTAGAVMSKSEQCRNTMARRYGPNTVALTGPCAGKSLADCACGKMIAAGKYSTSLLTKLASRLTDKDPMDECIEDHIRKGLDKSASCEKCDQLKKQALHAFEDEAEMEEIVDIPVVELGIGEDSGMDMGMDSGIISIDDFGEDDDMGLGDGLSGDLESQINELIDLAKQVLVEVTDEDADVDHGHGEDTALEIIEDEDTLLNDDSYESDEGGIDGLDNDGDGDHDMDDHDDEDSDDDEDPDDDPDGGLEADEACEASEGDELATMKKSLAEMQAAISQMEGGSLSTESSEMDDVEAPTEESDDKSESMTDFEEGEKMDNSQDSDNGLGNLAMSSSTIKRYNDGESLRSLTEADTMQINDILGDRKISDTPAEKSVNVEQSQDVNDIGTVSDGSTMGDEEKFDAKDPDVPTGDAKMGPDEDQDFEELKVPAGKGAMGSEKETIDTDVDVNMQGHAEHVASSDKVTKTAGEVTIGDPVALEDSADLKSQTLSNGSTLGAEEKFDAKDPDVFTGDAKMGPDEDQTFEKPTVPAGGGDMGSEKDTIDTDVDTEIKGTTIARSENKEILEAKVNAERIRLATKLASLEMMDGEIEPQDFDKEVDDLATSSVPTIKKLLARYEAKRKTITAHTKNTTAKQATASIAPQGLETPLLINTQSEAPNLKDEIKSLFSLQGQVDDFEDFEKSKYK
jgi:hypothetical protein